MLPTLILSSILGIFATAWKAANRTRKRALVHFPKPGFSSQILHNNAAFSKDVVICMEPPFGNVQHALLTSIKYIFRYALPAWEALIGYFDKPADDRKDFLDPRLHDNLLVDDESFTRSRKYFWALSRLSEFNLYIGSAIHQWKGLRDIWEKRFPERDPGGWLRAQEQMTEIDYLCEKLQAIRVRFQQHHKNITALRDGLFSASAVIESQASTRLGGQLESPLDRT
jgi:hypothetical protein